MCLATMVYVYMQYVLLFLVLILAVNSREGGREEALVSWELKFQHRYFPWLTFRSRE